MSNLPTSHQSRHAPPDRSKGPSQRSSLQSSWLVSFGDLLTLLLCFFVAIVAYHTQGAAHSPPTTDLTTENKEENPTRATLFQYREASGTPIANYNLRSQTLVLRLERSDFGEPGEQMTADAQRWFRNAVISNDYTLHAVRLEVCGTEASLSEGSSWLISMRRALDIRRQLIDAGLTTDGFELELLGPNCQRLNPKGGPGTVAALTLESERITNG